MGVIEKRGLLVQVREGKVRTGWRADPSVKIYRAEVAAAIERDGLKQKGTV